MTAILDTLLAQLNATGLQQKDARLYQVLSNLINEAKRTSDSLETETADLAGGITTTITTASLVGKTITVRNGIIVGFV